MNADAPPKKVVVKAAGRRPSEAFDREKFTRSIVATCRSLKVPDGQAEEIATLTAQDLDNWLADKAEITSSDLRRIGAEKLARYHTQAAYLYNQQLTVL